MSSKIIHIPTNLYHDKSIPQNINIDDYLEKINNTKNVITHLTYNNIKRGDVVHFEAFGSYLNDGKLIWDGLKLIPLEATPDNYGTLPKEFLLEEFGNNKNYFSDSISHNSIVYINGKNYKILSREIINTEYIDTFHVLYLYRVVYPKTKSKWYILTSMESEYHFRKDNLYEGIFMGNFEDDIWNYLNENIDRTKVLFGLDLCNGKDVY